MNVKRTLIVIST